MAESTSITGTWTVSSPNNGPGKFTFNTDNTGTYKMEGEQHDRDFYWWTSANSFWMQISNGVAGWLEIIEGSFSSGTAGTGSIIAAQQGDSTIVIETFSMTKD